MSLWYRPSSRGNIFLPSPSLPPSSTLPHHCFQLWIALTLSPSSSTPLSLLPSLRTYSTHKWILNGLDRLLREAYVGKQSSSTIPFFHSKPLNCSTHFKKSNLHPQRKFCGLVDVKLTWTLLRSFSDSPCNMPHVYFVPTTPPILIY